MIGTLHFSRYLKVRMKFVIDIPGTVKETVSLDEANENTLWKNAIKFETRNSHVALKLYEKGDKSPVGHTKITCHLIFDLKLDIKQKAQYVEGGHLTDVPTYITHFSVVICDTINIEFIMADLNNLYVLAGDIHNDFL